MFTIDKSKIEKTRYEYFIIGVNEKIKTTLSCGQSLTLSSCDNSLLVDENINFNEQSTISFFKRNFLNHREVIEFISNKINPKPFSTIF